MIWPWDVSQKLPGEGPAIAFAGLREFGVGQALLAEVLRHFEVMLQRRQRLSGPVLQFGIVAALA